MTAVYRRFGCKMAALTTVRNPFADQRSRGLATAERGWQRVVRTRLCLARDSLHSVPETWFTQLAFGESPMAPHHPTRAPTLAEDARWSRSTL